MSVSVVIPVFNAPRLIAETLESVLAQTVPVSEVLVIDDGSTDDTAAVAEQFVPRVRVFRRSNARQGASRNFGVQQASSEWIAFVDADDIWEPNKIERQMEELARNPKADLCYCAVRPFKVIDGNPQVESPYPIPDAKYIREALHTGPSFLPSTVLVRKSTFVKAGGFATHFKIAEDWDFWLRLLHSGAIFAACNEPLVRYRLHPGGVSRNTFLALVESKEVYRNQVVPSLPWTSRWIVAAKTTSSLESEAAMLLQKNGDSRCLALMAKSLARFPWRDRYRYRIFAQMLLKGPA